MQRSLQEEWDIEEDSGGEEGVPSDEGDGTPRKSVSASLINYSKDRQAMRNDFEVVPVGAGSEKLLSVSKFTPLDPVVQR